MSGLWLVASSWPVLQIASVSDEISGDTEQCCPRVGDAFSFSLLQCWATMELVSAEPQLDATAIKFQPHFFLG